MPPPPKPKIVAEYAKSGRSSCKTCSTKIPDKALRLGLISKESRGFDSTKWYHLRCFPHAIESTDTIGGFASLQESDQEALKKLVGAFESWAQNRKREFENEEVGLEEGSSKRSKIDMASNNSHPFSLRSVLENNKLNGSNFLDWTRNLRIVLKQEKKLEVLDHPLPNELARTANVVAREAFEKKRNDSNDVTCLMLATMSPELQKQFVDSEAFEIMTHLKEMFQEQARHERFVTTKALTSCKMAPGTSVSVHVLKMKGYIDTLEKLDAPICEELATDLILGSLPESYDQFVMNFNMHGMTKTIAELHGMLKNAEQNIKKINPVLLVQKGKGNGGIGKGKPNAKPKDKVVPKSKGNGPKAPKPKPLKEGVCFHCNKSGHWKRNCLIYLEELKKNGGWAFTSGIQK